MTMAVGVAVKIKNNTTQEYRAQEPKVPNHGTIQKPKPKPTSSTTRKSKPAFNPDEMMDVFMNSSVSENVAPEVVADELTLELIGASVAFVEIDFRSEKNKGKRAYYNGSLNSLSSEMLRSVIDSYQAHLALRVGHDRHLCPAWRWRYLVDRALARDNPLSSPYNIDSELSRSGAVNRVKDEYTLRDKDNLVMHMRKKEFQDRDLLYPLEQPVDTVKALRLAIANYFLEANHITRGKYLDVSN
ncbi:hypothetical protein ZWY2020_021701 [Hordeum vulgare]|nr:hypothetical protein ZWY2020_021701 [Hordeum vulgare]